MLEVEFAVFSEWIDLAQNMLRFFYKDVLCYHICLEWEILCD